MLLSFDLDFLSCAGYPSYDCALSFDHINVFKTVVSEIIETFLRNLSFLLFYKVCIKRVYKVSPGIS